ncbi:addiction module protein [Bowmanella denitrificans]|uniref:addiction module protein n=1 Tax=Bowmanella denitrificans TaxID=366582 RepID=UPI000C9AAA0E|nr:addiction module protein [Bowmanella denitrificans]
MSDALRTMLEYIGKLNNKEKAIAAHCLLTAMNEKSDCDVDADWLKLAELRSAELESGKVEGRCWADIKKDIVG